jgi:uncharacterized membrane protein
MKNPVVLGMVILAAFVMIVSIASLYAQSEIEHSNACSCSFPIHLLIPILSSAGLLAGSAIYCAFSPRGKTHKDFMPLLKLLNYDERRIIEVLAKSSGTITQSRMVKATGFNKVKISRLITTLETKGVIIKSPKGMTNQIELSNDLRGLFD